MHIFLLFLNRLGGVVVTSVFVSSAVEIVDLIPGQVQPKTKINICCFTAKHVVQVVRTETGYFGVGIMS